ncbi:MAG: DUF6036 family nucleotidyltransferase [Opitutaceae bacterium]
MDPNNTRTGNFVIVTKTGHVFGATHIEATPEGYTCHLKGLKTNLTAPELERAYQVDPGQPAARIDPGLLSTLIWLEKGLVEFNQLHPPTQITIFGAGSLAFTILPDRSTNDLDTIVSDQLAAFLKDKGLPTDVEVEMLDERLLQFLGPWASRACQIVGPLGAALRLVHPLDTAMQKLLRYNEERFLEKDLTDIEQIILHLKPDQNTLINLLIENPARYARLSGRFASQADAIERNTRVFLSSFLPELTFEEIVRRTGDRAVEGATAAGLFPKTPALGMIKTDLRGQLRASSLSDLR